MDCPDESQSKTRGRLRFRWGVFFLFLFLSLVANGMKASIIQVRNGILLTFGVVLRKRCLNRMLLFYSF
jgi:hypothetical protein